MAWLAASRSAVEPTSLIATVASSDVAESCAVAVALFDGAPRTACEAELSMEEPCAAIERAIEGNDAPERDTACCIWAIAVASVGGIIIVLDTSGAYRIANGFHVSLRYRTGASGPAKAPIGISLVF
jgi:hypothetical protein